MAPHFVWEAFVIANIEPIFLAVGGPSFENAVDFLDHCFRQFVFCVVDDVVDAAEVIRGFNDVVYSDGIVLAFRESDSVGLIDVPGLLMSQSAAFDVVRIVGKVYLSAMVYAAAHFAFFLFA